MEIMHCKLEQIEFGLILEQTYVSCLYNFKCTLFTHFQITIKCVCFVQYNLYPPVIHKNHFLSCSHYLKGAVANRNHFFFKPA